MSFSDCAAFNFTAPFSDILCMSLSATWSSTNTSFSPMRRRLLSNAAPKMMALAARVGQQVSSTKTGGLPGPAQIARLPVCIAAGWFCSARI